ncbi:hypothetical protein [Synechococcus sp. BMK-MC-1]|uniref:hypothetical protein n=1 Tax=Synechococcus sp. BMK-MC-1 TaxID=1442551 RepID=UPI0016494649|nr:hypothetical protein [Synechococcus sp. BMK-MC-1]QNI66387.1 hypothetical protein SynBMKMC1_00274 [Synechococcus sp. BMK-MC-1]
MTGLASCRAQVIQPPAAGHLLEYLLNLSICFDAAVAVLSASSLEAPPSDARLVADACLKAAAELGFSKDALGDIVGRHRTSLERSGLEPSSKEGQLGLLFLRVVRSLDALMGADVELMRHWMEQSSCRRCSAQAWLG